MTGPLYHAAPLGLNFGLTFGNGLGQVLMDKWDAEEVLRLVDRHGITHSHMVATMFHRMLALPEDVKASYDLSSLRWLLHGAAPCPVHIKQGMIDWLGPVVYEYYAATEGGSYYVDSPSWLARPGTVGQIVEGGASKILDEHGYEVERGEIGTIYFLAPENRFEYFKAPEKTGEAYNPAFAAMARSCGIDGVSVDRAGDLGDAIRAGIAAGRPYVIDANIGIDQNPGGAGVWELPGLGRSAPVFGSRYEHD